MWEHARWAVVLSEWVEWRYVPELAAWLDEVVGALVDAPASVSGEGDEADGSEEAPADADPVSEEEAPAETPDDAANSDGEDGVEEEDAPETDAHERVKRVVFAIVEKMLRLGRNSFQVAWLQPLVARVAADPGAAEIVRLFDELDERPAFTFTTVPRTRVGMIKQYNPRLRDTSIQKIRGVKQKVRHEEQKAAKEERERTAQAMQEKRVRDEKARAAQKKAYGKILNELQTQQSEWKRADKLKAKGKGKKMRRNSNSNE